MAKYNIASNMVHATPGAAMLKGRAQRQQYETGALQQEAIKSDMAAREAQLEIQRQQEERLGRAQDQAEKEFKAEQWNQFIESVAPDVHAENWEAVDAKARAAGLVPEGAETDEEDMAILREEIAKLAPAEEKADYTIDGIRYSGKTDQPIAGMEEKLRSEAVDEKQTAAQVNLQNKIDLIRREGDFANLNDEEWEALMVSEKLKADTKGAITLDEEEAEKIANRIINETPTVLGENWFGWDNDEVEARMAFEIRRLAKDGKFDAEEIERRAIVAGLGLTWEEVELGAKEDGVKIDTFINGLLGIEGEE